MANALAEKMLKNSVLDNVRMIQESDMFSNTMVQTKIPMLNVALSGKFTGGLYSGLLMIAGESKTFKTMFSLIMCAAYLDEFKDAVMVMYDSEFGSPPAYLEKAGIDTSRVIHCPIHNVEELKFDMIKKLGALKRGERVVFFIDSVGNLASKKEAEDAAEQKSVTDMTRAKSLKSMWRIVTPYFTTLDIPCIAINHVYKEQGTMYPKAVVSGGTGGIYSSNTIWIVTKAQNKEGDDLVGFDFKIFIEKSRTVREKSLIPITVDYEFGVNQWSGMFDLALEFGYISVNGKGWYSRSLLNKETGELVMEEKRWRKKDTNSKEFWGDILQRTPFIDDTEKKYTLDTDSPLIQADADFVNGLYIDDGADDE